MKAFSERVRHDLARQSSLVVLKVGADVTGKAITLFVTIAAARALTTTEFGVWSLAMTAGWLLGVATDAGLSMFLARAAAANRADLPGVWRDVLCLRSGLAAAAFGVAMVLLSMVGPDGALTAAAIIVAAQLSSACLETVFHVFRGRGRADIEARAHLVNRGVAGLWAVGALATGGGLLGLAIALAVPPAVGLAWAIGRGERMVGAPSSDATGALTATTFWREAAPLGLAVLVAALYFRCDLFFIERWHGLESVASYNAAFRLVEAVRLLPAAALAVGFPWLVRTATLQPLRLMTTALASVGAGVGASIAILAGPLLEWLYGPPYADAAPVLRLLAASVPLFFVNYALTHQLIAWNGPGRFLVIAVAALVTNVTFNLALVPERGAAGAAVSTLVTEVVVCVGCLLALRKVRVPAPRVAVLEAPS